MQNKSKILSLKYLNLDAVEKKFGSGTEPCTLFISGLPQTETGWKPLTLLEWKSNLSWLQSKSFQEHRNLKTRDWPANCFLSEYRLHRY